MTFTTPTKTTQTDGTPNADPFLGLVFGKLTVVARERRASRWGYVCFCSGCGELTRPRRAEYIRRRGERSACDNCTHGVPSVRVREERPVSSRPEKQRHLPSGHPIWRERAARLAAVVSSPMPLADVIALGKRFGWSEEVSREVLASADGHELVKVRGLWKRGRSPLPVNRKCG